MTSLQHNATINITRLENGIPRIAASNDADTAYGLGYCHAIDRGMQVMVMKILGRGTASEHLAATDEMLEVDKFFRRANWHNNLEKELDKLNSEELRLIESYCQGMKAGFRKQKPWELRMLLGYKEFEWEPKDVIMLIRMSSYLTLAQSQMEVERFFIQLVQQGVSDNQLEELFPGVKGEYDREIINKLKLDGYIVPDSIKWHPAASAFMASNNWVIAGAHTKSGAPIFANDPHLEVNRLPAVWYEAVTDVNGQYVHGATMPGLPLPVFGRNNDVAWGLTYAFIDASDSWIEKCKDGRYYKDDQWHEFSTRTEVINRKKKDPVTITFYENEHGTLEGDPHTEEYCLSTRWTGDVSGAMSIRAGMLQGKASTVAESMEGSRMVEGAFSWVSADREGNIGFQMSGVVPKRKAGWSGFTPQPGWVAENDWQGYHDSAELPNSINPEEGFLVTANHDLNHLGKLSPINICMGDYRARRIEHLLSASSEHTVQTIQSIQYDTKSMQAERFMQIIRPLLPDSPAGKILYNWDYSYEPDSQGAYLFERVYSSLYQQVFGLAVGLEVVEFLENETGIFVDFYNNFDRVLLADESVWFKEQSREDLYTYAITTALDCPIKTWGEYNTFTMSHMIFGGQLPGFLGFDRGPFPMRGGRASISQGQIFRSTNRITSFAPSFRIISDLSEHAIHTNYPGGVSDRRFSRLYNNNIDNWLNGIYTKYDHNDSLDNDN